MGYPLLGVQGDTGPLAPLVLEYNICETPENVERNIRATLARDYLGFLNQLASQAGSVSICGSGPSLEETYQDITGDVLACNAAHDFLIGKGIIPKFAMMFDAGEVMEKMVHPHPDVTYLLASRCHPKVFERFADHKVLVWHSAGDECTERLLVEHKPNEPMIGGGSAAVTRAMFLVWAMGYTTQHLFGADSSSRGSETHVRKSLVEEQRLPVWLAHARRWFDTTPWMAAQVEDFKLMAPALRGAKGRVVVHGDGLLPAVANELGFETPNYLGLQ